MKVSIASLKRRLTVGTRFRGRWTGAQSPGASRDWHGREVVANASQLASLLLDGPKKGVVAYLTWAGLKAVQCGGEVALSGEDGREFMRLAFDEAAVAR